MDYLKVPLDFSSPTGGKLQRCSSEESIAQHIMILITSHYGEVVGKYDYGSSIWELEFNQLVKISDWEENVKKSLIETIERFERRLKDINVSVVLSEVDNDIKNRNNTHIRRKAQISVSGKLKTNETPFNFSTLIYISPISQ